MLSATGRVIDDVIAPGLDVLFCGINPGLYSAATGHHFARPGNRFWRALREGGFTPRRLQPWEERELLRYGCGITNLVARSSAAAAELTAAELAEGGRQLVAKLEMQQPRWLAVLGIGVYRTAFGRPETTFGRQRGSLGPAGVWVLPNPSGLNAHYQPPALARLFAELREAIG